MNVLIIKLGALGDVLRTTPLLTALHGQHKSLRVTWLVDERHRMVLENNPLIAELLSYGEQALKKLAAASFDWVLNLDKEPEALNAMQKVSAQRKSGFLQGPGGELAPADTLSQYAFKLGVDDELKFRKNKKTYQEICFEQAGLVFQGEDYLFSISDENRSQAEKILKSAAVGPAKLKKPVIGLNTGSGWRFAGKKLSRELVGSVAEKLVRELDATVLLLGGEDERARNAWIEKNVSVPVVNTGSHSIGVFAAIVEQCQLVITGDTTAMHIAIAVKAPTLVHFGSTCSSEIELYGRGRKLVASIPCAPCYKRVCPLDEPCMKTWTADEILQQAKEILTCETSRIS